MKNGHPAYSMLLRFQALKMRFIILLNHKWVTLSWTRNIGIFYITSHIVSASLNLVSQLEIFCPAWQWWFWRRRKQPTSWKSLQGVQRGERWHFSYHEFVWKYGNCQNWNSLCSSFDHIFLPFDLILILDLLDQANTFFLHNKWSSTPEIPCDARLSFTQFLLLWYSISKQYNYDNIFLMLTPMLGLIILSDGEKKADSAGFRR